jgi:CAAX prenyl protease-like protein
MDNREGHGWWPYLGPYAGFMAIGQLASWMPEATEPYMLGIKPLVPAGLLFYFWSQGRYPELRNIRFQPGWRLLDILVGLLLTVQWMLPYFLVDLPLFPEAADGFNPAMAGDDRIGLILALRFFGYALVTPVFEELFIRSFVMRYAEVYNSPRDFRDVPLAYYSVRSFITTVVVFTVGHIYWEWWVAIPWVILTNLWFYLRKDMGSTILVHATTNPSILVYVALATGGQPGSILWVFV